MNMLSFLDKYILAILKFCRNKFLIWLQIIVNPAEFISKLHLKYPDSILSALGFVLFVYLLTTMLAIPKFLMFYSCSNILENEVLFISDFILTIIALILMGLCFHISAKIVLGHGRLWYRGLIVGLYMTAFWLFFVFLDYIILQSSKSIPDLLSFDINNFDYYEILYYIFLFFLLIYIQVKVIPVIKYVYLIGAFRAGFAVFLWIVLTSFTYELILSHLFQWLRDCHVVNS